MQQTSRDEEGTLAYIRATGSLFLKVSQGWKEIQVLTWSNGQRLSKVCFECALLFKFLQYNIQFGTDHVFLQANIKEGK